MTKSYDTPTPNTPLMRKTVEWVEEQDKLSVEESQWRQGDWCTTKVVCDGELFSLQSYGTTVEDLGLWAGTYEEVKCGTAFCVAGKIAYDAGLDMDTQGVIVSSEDPHLSGYIGEHCSEYAEDALGLEPWQSTQLFSGSNGAEDIRRMCEAWTKEKL